MNTKPGTDRIKMNRINDNFSPPTGRLLQLGQNLALLLAIFTLLLFTACSSDADPAADNILDPLYGTDAEGARYVGADRCLSCHENPGKVTNTDPAATYLASRHATPGTIGADADQQCLACHDPIGDGLNLGPWFTDHQQPPAGMTAVGCEACHGAGTLHWLNFPEHPNPTPDYQACGQCHQALPAGHSAYAGQGSFTGYYADDILDTYRGSAHAGQVNKIGALCQRCHSDEGFRAYAGQTVGMDGEELTEFLPGAGAIADPSPIQCRTCHDGHTGELRASPTVVQKDGKEITKYSRLFNLCTACHQVFLKAEYSAAEQVFVYYLDTEKIPFHGALDDAGLPVPSAWVIWDTHFATKDGARGGWPVNPASENACMGCHDPHAASKPVW
ncbi:hypothetical protein [Desulfurivibrio dismutans]|uniref:hypothetical protein n=1 Tax=Desulfurivibrio dismutans TaxID=1398908 RepID=UPI0023DC0A74|nr:hypothetical protein [Desulfurivibrio alkaliphilus]MDF1613737.1 hypothetical protein [Desulfurivibrio alkaliphilus]